MKSADKLGSVYRCPVCGAEVSVMRHGGGSLGPFCCNVAMELTDTINRIFRCTLCASEVMAIKEGEGTLEPFCCDNLMVSINA
jgi:desulfoferrodoxin-like iron-binding protein